VRGSGDVGDAEFVEPEASVGMLLTKARNLGINFLLARHPRKIDAKCGDDFLRGDYLLLKPVRKRLGATLHKRHEKMSQ
jgi:hypothetical protein